MRDVSIVAFCGLGSKFIEQIRKPLQSQNSIVIALVRRESDEYADYLERLSRRILDIIEKLDSNDRVVVLLVTASQGDERALERQKLYPAVRCLTTDSSIQKSPALGISLVTRIHQTIADWRRDAIWKMARARHDSVFLLPLRNCGIKNLSGWIDSLCEFESIALPRSVEKRVSRQPDGMGIAIGSLIFKGVVNGNVHPVRRCTVSHSCDLRAILRVGHLVPTRFEFDVTSKAPLANSRFCLCDGSVFAVPRQATHLNMRINDDFKIGI